MRDFSHVKELPIASRKKVLEMRFIASNEKVLEMVNEKLR
jgi:hypothetical protein